MSNTSTTDKVVVGGALVGGLLFFGFLTSTCTSPFSIGDDDAAGDQSTATPVAAEVGDTKKDDSRVADLQKQMNALKLKNADLSELKKDNKALRSEIVSTSNSLKEKLANLQKRNGKLKEQLEASKGSLAQLKNKFSKMSGDAGTALQDKNNELQAELDLSNTKIKNLKKQIADMSSAPAAEGVAPAKVAALNATIKDLNTKNSNLTTDLGKLAAQLKMANAKPAVPADSAANAAKVKQLTEALAAKDAEANKLNAQVNQLKAQKNVFVKSTDDLPKSAQTLFADLKTLEGKSVEEVNAAYKQITQKNNSVAKARVRFRSGKSNLTSAEKAKIAALTQAAGENSYFLIVGYADKTGSAAANEKLSSARSTSVAKELASKAKGFQAAQAVYLGQTDRFGPASENRVVEIWEIK